MVQRITPAGVHEWPSCAWWHTTYSIDAADESAAELGQIVCGAQAEQLVIAPRVQEMLDALPNAQGIDDWLWDLCEPESVSDAHRMLQAAGAEVQVTNTFGCAAHLARQAHISDALDELDLVARRATRCAHNSQARFVLGGVGPLQERGTESKEASGADAREARRAQAIWRALAEKLLAGDASGLYASGFAQLDEFKLCCEALSQVSRRPLIAGIPWQQATSGAKLNEWAEALWAAGAHVLCLEGVPLAQAAQASGALVDACAKVGCAPAILFVGAKATPETLTAAAAAACEHGVHLAGVAPHGVPAAIGTFAAGFGAL